MEENIKDNIIIGYFDIKNNNSKERIINSFENIKRGNPRWNWYKIESKENEKQIKECDIYINNQRIDFSYFYNFEKKGKYKIIYKFKQLMTSTNYMFFNCKSLISLDLSNFNAQKVTNMNSMFIGCGSLMSLDLLKLNTEV